MNESSILDESKDFDSGDAINHTIIYSQNRDHGDFDSANCSMSLSTDQISSISNSTADRTQDVVKTLNVKYEINMIFKILIAVFYQFLAYLKSFVVSDKSE